MNCLNYLITRLLHCARNDDKKGQHAVSDRQGFILVLVLLIVAVLIAAAVEFASGVFVNVSGLGNLDTMEKLSVEGSSLIASSSGMLMDAIKQGYIQLGGEDMKIPIENGVDLSFHAADENSKFNLNTLVSQNGDVNKEAYDSFKRLLKNLHLDENIADKAVNWINRNPAPSSQPSSPEGSVSTGPGYLQSTPELRLFIDGPTYDKLVNYVTVYGDGSIDINTADAPVLMSLSGEMSKDLADRIITRRQMEPFKNTGELSTVAGFEKLGMELLPRITASSSAIGLRATAEEDGITRIVEGVVDANGRIIYWREY